MDGFSVVPLDGVTVSDSVFPVVLPGRPNVLRIVIEQLAARHDIALKVRDCDSLPAIAKLVCDARYMAVMPHFAFVDEIARGEMVAIPIEKQFAMRSDIELALGGTDF